MKSAFSLASFLVLVVTNIVSAGTVAFGVEREMKESGEKGGTEDINIGVGELVESALTDVFNLGPVSSYSFDLGFDTSILSFVSAEDVLFGGTTMTADPLPAGVRLSASGLSPSSEGRMFLFTLRGIAEGISTIAIIDEHVFDTQSPPQAYPAAGANVMTITVVPEPATLLFAALGLTACVGSRATRRATV